MKWIRWLLHGKPEINERWRNGVMTAKVYQCRCGEKWMELVSR